MIDLDAIEARAAKATPGKWIPKHTKTVYLADGSAEHEVRVRETGENVAYILDTVDGDQRERDLQFISAARQDVPALVAEVRNARKALSILRRWWVDHYGGLGKRIQDEDPAYAGDVFALGLGCAPDDLLPPRGANDPR